MSARGRWSLLLWTLFNLWGIFLIVHNPSHYPTPLRSWLQDKVTLFAIPFVRVVELIGQWKGNRHLKEELARIKLDRARLSLLEEENRRLREMLELQRSSPYRLIPGDVIGQTADLTGNGFVVNRGERDGVKPSAAVIDHKGLVGRVWRVSDESCVVQNITDPQLGIPAQLVSSGAKGIANWRGRRRMVLRGIPTTVKVAKGDTVVTASAGAVFPPYLLVGIVDSVRSAEETWLWEIDITPFTDVPFLGEVFIVLSPSL